jgi:hypothetical protein
MWSRLSRLVDPAKPSAGEALARIAKLRESGRTQEALRFAADQYRRMEDPRLATALMSLRHAAFAAGQGRPDWPPSLPDRFQSGIPEIRATDLTTETLGAGILHHGAIIIRGLIDPETVRALRGGIDRALDELRRVGEGAAQEGSPWYARAPDTIDHEVNKSRVFTELGGAAMLAGDSPRTFQTIVDLYEKLGVFSAVEGYLGERPALSLAKTVLRRVPVTTGTDWHQDGAFLGSAIRVVNLWVAISDCGVDAPGLDIVPKRIPRVLPTGVDSYFDWSVGEGTVKEALGDSRIETPVFGAGDAMMFDHLFLHRTAIRPEMTKDRYAIEAWMFAPSTFPAENYALVV